MQNKRRQHQTLPRVETVSGSTVFASSSCARHQCLFDSKTTNYFLSAVTVSTLQISEAPILYQDQQLQEFLIDKEDCHNFINKDLTFLQPPTVYETTELDDSISSASDSTEVSVITVQENNQHQ